MPFLESSFWHAVLAWLVTSGLHIALIVAGSVLAIFLLRRLTRRLEKALADDKDSVRARERQQRAATIRRALDGVIILVVVLIAGITILWEMGVEIVPLLAGASVAGIAISLGAQTLVRDILAGLFILIEDHFSIGDTVTAAGVSGVVEKMTLRATTLRDLEGTLHTIPNGEMRVVSNKTKDWSRVVLRVGVAYGTDLDQAMQILQQVGQDLAADPEWQERVLEPPGVSGVDDLRASDIALLFLAKTAPGDQWAVAREARKRIVQVFAREGIEMPYPTQVHLVREVSS